MAEVAAHLVTNVIPYVPTRQWVLSLPWALRFHLVANPALCRAIASAILDAVFAHHVRAARAAGHCEGPESYAHPGAVNFVQRFGSSLQANVHFHALVLDGAYVTQHAGDVPVFCPSPPLTDLEVARVQADARQRIGRILRARGLFSEPGEEPPTPEGAEGSAMPLLWSALLLSRTAAGTGDKVPRLVDPSLASAPREPLDLPRGALTATSDGYSLHAATRIEADERESLERLLRYMARPPLAQGRLMLREDGKVIWNLRKPWRDGTRGLVFDPLTFIGRLAAIVPHSREHQLTYHGVLAPASPLRDHVVLRPPSSRARGHEPTDHAHDTDPNQPSEGPRFSWADLLKRVFAKDVLKCPRCGSRRHMLAAISDGRTIRRILAHLGLPTEPLPIAPAREPPQAEFAW